MNKISCDKCGVGLYSDIPLKEWTCSPCIEGILPSTLTCIACSLSNGVLISTKQDEWIHLFCALLLKQYVTSKKELKVAKQALNCTINVKIPQELFELPCALCKSAKRSVVLACSTCKQAMHIACSVNNAWKIIGESFECGCVDKKKSVKKPKIEEMPPVRGPNRV